MIHAHCPYSGICFVEVHVIDFDAELIVIFGIGKYYGAEWYEQFVLPYQFESLFDFIV
jgi:hypothetical protein